MSPSDTSSADTAGREHLERLVLASGSPRRRELLTSMGLDFEVRPAALDESVRSGEEPAAYVTRLARDKARLRVEPGETVLAADTAVVVDEEILGKPRDRAEARCMLVRLAGRTHEVMTGVALAWNDGGAVRDAVEVSVSRVRFTAMSDRELDWYANTGEGLDKAGAYAIQGLGAWFVEAIDGNYSNVVGLPLPLVYRLLGQAGLDPLVPPSTALSSPP